MELKAPAEEIQNSVNQNDKQDTAAKIDINETDASREEKQIFNDEILGIQFTYPDDWTITTELVDYNNAKNTDEIYQKIYTLKINDNDFLVSQTAGEMTDRGAFWGDWASRIKSADYISNFCDTYQTENFAYGENARCEVLKNNNNIEIARLHGSAQWFGDVISNNDSYFIYNPDNDFYGIIIDTQNFADNGVVPQSISKQINDLVMSLKFE
ncbi:hypothetical protein D6827_02515 [Candidatus Parcubacteria bacterium]|nr:MAG: hypothetical protein D6827_02515 [Candidatus Parcubacteria bacterium]